MLNTPLSPYRADPESSAVHSLLVVVPEGEVAWWDLAAAALGPQRAFRVVILGEDKVLTSGADFLKTSAPK